MEDVNRCVCCGDIIPEGRWACPRCEKEPCLHLWQFQGFVNNAKGERMLHWKCAFCAEERMVKKVERSILWPEEDA